MGSDDELVKMNRCLSKILLIITVLALVTGSILRIGAFNWNNRLQGDVNLFALTAREFVVHSRLYYPMKSEYSDNVEYQVLRSPASQHPPLWPFVSGLLGKVFHTDDTFLILKATSEIAGILLIAIIAFVGMYTGWLNEALLATSFVGVSPMLVDFSANGSPYILLATMIILAMTMLEHFHYQTITDYVLAGILCGIALQVHSVMMFMPVTFFAFWLCERSRLRWKGVVAFLFAGLLVLTPWISWNLLHFGKPFYSYSIYFLLEKLDLAQHGIYGDVITTRMTGAVNFATIRLYISMVADSALNFSLFYLLEVGPFCLALALVGGFTLFRSDRRKATAFALPPVLYTTTIFLWATFKYRFLVPLLPATYIGAAFGFMELYDRRPLWKSLRWICLVGTIVWGAQGFLEQPPTRYYHNDASHAAHYEKMLPLARELEQLEPGVVLGYSRSLDGGLETIYWHRFPFVYGRGFNKVEEVRKLVHDFDIRYIWADQATVHHVESYFPEAKISLGNELYYVLEISE